MYSDEIYLDASKLGKTISISISIFDESVSPKFLVGVYGLELAFEKLSKFHNAEKQIIDYINKKHPPPRIKISKVTLE